MRRWNRIRRNQVFVYSVLAVILYLSAALTASLPGRISALAGGAGLSALLFSAAGVIAGLRTKRSRFRRGAGGIIGTVLCLCIALLILRTFIGGF